MAIPIAEVKAWGVFVAEEFASAPAPYFGVNVIDVATPHWEAFLRKVREIIELEKQRLGLQLHLWAVRDHGQRKRVLWINRFPQPVRKELLEGFKEWGKEPVSQEFFGLIDSYQWFLVTEQPSAEP